MVFVRRVMGNETEAKCYIRKIRHETIRISVIQRLEEYLNINQEGVSTPSVTSAKSAPVEEEEEEEEDNDDDQETRRASSPLPEIRRWVDHCKRLFLWYYHIYLVHNPLASPHLVSALLVSSCRSYAFAAGFN